MADTKYVDGAGIGWLRVATDKVYAKKKDIKSVNLPIPHVLVERSAAGDSAILKIANNWTGCGNVVVRYKIGSEPSETDLEFPSSGYTVTANGNTIYVRAFPGEGNNSTPSPSACVTVSNLQVQTPTINFNEETKTVTLNCATPGVTIRYTTDGENPSATTGNVYSEAFIIKSSTIISVQAYKENLLDSEIASKKFSFTNIFGVELNLSSSSSVLTRLTPETDPLGIVTETITTEPISEITGTRTGSSPFDAYTQLYGAMKRRNFETDGTPGVWEGEPGFTLTDKDVMVWIPKFWYKVVNDTNSQKRRYYIASTEEEGFKLHPGSGQYIGAYATSNNNQSRSGKTITTSQTLSTMRTNARAKGSGWQLRDAAERNAITFLFLIEFANTNCQAMIGQGPGTTTKTTGDTDVMTYHTGRPSGTDGQTSVKYRGIENLWGAFFEFEDGRNNINRIPYYSTDRNAYASNTTAGYKACGGEAPSQAGYVKSTKYVEVLDWVISEYASTGGSATTYFCDRSGTNIGNCFSLTGGPSLSSGLFGLYAFTSDTSGSAYGSRLSYKEE